VVNFNYCARVPEVLEFTQIYPVDLYPAYLPQASFLIRYSKRKFLIVTKIKLEVSKTFKRVNLFPLNITIYLHNPSVHSPTHLSHRGTSSQIPWRQHFGSCIRNNSSTANSTFILFGNRQHVKMYSGAKTYHLLSLMQCYVLPKNKIVDKHRNYTLSTFLMNIPLI